MLRNQSDVEWLLDNRTKKHVRVEICFSIRLGLLNHLIKATIPAALQSVVLGTLEESPSPATLSKRQVCLDMALSDVFAQFSPESCPIYLTADSSWQASHELMLALIDYIDGGMLPDAFASSIFLAQSAQA